MLADKLSQAEIEAAAAAAAEEAEDDEAMAEYEAKGGISNEAVMAWIRSWGTEAELPRPQIGD
jgi:predicted transcriptional regulator